MVGKMSIESLSKFWPLMYSVAQKFWSLSEPHIEAAALRNDIQIELYLYSELGLDRFSIADFQKRDPFSNPEQFERLFVHRNVKCWIEPMADGSFRVTLKRVRRSRDIAPIRSVLRNKVHNSVNGPSI